MKSSRTFFLGMLTVVFAACETEGILEAPAKDSWQIFKEQGLGSDGVYSIMQDQKGTIWAGTEGSGIYQYKEGAWTNLQASSSTFLDDWVYCLKEDPDGNIYVGSWGGISRFNGSSWASYETNSAVMAAEYYPPDKKMYFGLAGTGFVIRSAGTYDSWAFTDTSMNYINAVYCDSRNWLWFGTQHGIMRMNSSYQISKFTPNNGLSKEYVRCFFEDSRQRLWIGFWKGSTVQWYENGTFHDAPLMSGFNDNYILSIAEDMQGNIWFGARYRGAFKYNGSIMEILGPANGLCDNTIVSICRDRENQLWLGGLEGGITRLRQTIQLK